MSDFDTQTHDNDVEVEIPTDETETETEEEAKPKAESKKKELPEECVTPTGLTNHLNTKFEGTEGWTKLAPQQMYGWHKNGKDFPRYTDSDGVVHETSPNDGRYIVPLEAGEEWVLGALERQKARKAAKTAKEAAAEAATAEAPEVEVDSVDVDLA